jgi:hypothetical protein
MELIRLYFEMLKDASVPAHRIVRKTAALTVAGIVFLIFYRHVSLGFDLGKPMLVTLGLAFMLFAVVGIFGGVLGKR